MMPSRIASAVMCCVLLFMVFMINAAENSDNEITTIVLVGCTGNLAKKYLWQILFDVAREGSLGQLQIVGGATSAKATGDDKLEAILNNDIKCSGEDCGAALTAFRSITRYEQMKYAEHYGMLDDLLEREYAARGLTEVGRLYYLSVSPDFYPSIAESINTLARPATPGAWVRVVVEKPFGRDLGSANELAEALYQNLKEDEIYRVDHYLGKGVVRAMLPFRSANAGALDPVWNRRFVRKVEVVMKETEDCEGRTKFYDRYGAVRDVLQNHVSELLTLMLLPLPSATDTAEWDEAAARTRVLSSLTAESTRGAEEAVGMLQQLKRSMGLRLGQYNGYAAHVASDLGLSEVSEVGTPTAASVLLQSNAEDWQDVPLLATSGKALDTREAFAVVMFDAPKLAARPGTNSDLAQRLPDGLPDGLVTCELRFGVQGGETGEAILVRGVLSQTHKTFADAASQKEVDGACVALLMGGEIKAPEGWAVADGGTRLTPVVKFPNAYRVVMDSALAGDRGMFLGTPELMASWGLWTPLLEVAEGMKPIPYTPGWRGFESEGFGQASADMAPLPTPGQAKKAAGRIAKNLHKFAQKQARKAGEL